MFLPEPSPATWGLVLDSSSAVRGFLVGLVCYFIVSLVSLPGALITIFTIAIGFGVLLMTNNELVIQLGEEQMV